MQIGLCGTGNMGAALGDRLLDQGCSVLVWNRSPQRAAPLLGRGASAAATPRELVNRCNTVIVMLFDDAALNAVYEGPEGLLSGALADTLILEMSTVLPDTVSALADRVRAGGGAFVECPVGGTVAPARSGKLLGMAGGSEEDLKQARPVLSTLCRRVEHVGPVGAGAAMKLAINLPLIVYWEALGEALGVCESAGIQRELAADILADSAGAIPMAGARVADIVSMMGGGAPGAASFRHSASTKDLNLVMALAGARGLELPVADAARRCYEAALAQGWGDFDFPMQAAWRARTATKG